jgi:DNA-binding CsgD family transcriptional regulator
MEQRVLELYNKGYSRKQAAKILNVSENTYAWYLRQIRVKFEISSRKEMLELGDKLNEACVSSS